MVLQNLMVRVQACSRLVLEVSPGLVSCISCRAPMWICAMPAGMQTAALGSPQPLEISRRVVRIADGDASSSCHSSCDPQEDTAATSSGASSPVSISMVALLLGR